MHHKNKLLVAGCILSLPLHAFAEDSKSVNDGPYIEIEEQPSSSFYLGGLLGNATSKEQFDNVFNVNGSKYRQESDNATLGIYAGFNFANKWSLEASILITPGLDERPSSIAIDDAYITVFTLTPVINFPITNSIDLYAKAGLGIIIYVEEYHEHSIYNHDDGDYWVGIGFTVGVGLEFKTTKKIRFRIGFDYIDAELEADEENHHINLQDVEEQYSLASMSMHYHF